MLTKTYEFIKVMCSHYWPLHTNKPQEYGPFTVTMLSEETYAHYKVRTLLLNKSGCVGDHRVTQYHFDRWPAHTCPSPSALLQFVRRLSAGLAEMRADGEDGVPVVHCGDGGGRSGAFIVIMENLRMIEERGEVN